MSNKKVVFIAGAGRGMGVDFAKATLAAGHAVVASGRDTDRVSKSLGPSNDLLAVTLDVTRRGDSEAAVRAAVDRFGRIDVLINNAAGFYAGYFEELTPDQFDRQCRSNTISSPRPRNDWKFGDPSGIRTRPQGLSENPSGTRSWTVLR